MTTTELTQTKCEPHTAGYAAVTMIREIRDMGAHYIRIGDMEVRFAPELPMPRKQRRPDGWNDDNGEDDGIDPELDEARARINANLGAHSGKVAVDLKKLLKQKEAGNGE
jgi:hypothetical protein